MSQKIDWTTLGFTFSSRSTSMALTTSFQNYLSIDISHFPTGARLLFMVDIIFAGNGTATTYSARLSDGTVTIAPTNNTGTWYTTINMCSADYRKIDDVGTINLQVKKDNTNNVNASLARVSVFRVG